jgi:hypothetical protein
MQHVEVIEPQARDERLLQLLSKHHSSRKNRIIIFVLYKKEAPRVESLLTRKGWKVGAVQYNTMQSNLDWCRTARGGRWAFEDSAMVICVCYSSDWVAKVAG